MASSGSVAYRIFPKNSLGSDPHAQWSVESNEMHSVIPKANDNFSVSRFQDGTTYEGQMAKGMREGFGKLVWPDGAMYEGNYKNGRMHGMGTLIKASKSRYTGSFVDGRFEGQGEYESRTGYRYKGEFIAGYRNGQGICYYLKCGGTYDGHYVDDKKHGHGVYKKKGGEIYDGEWSNGLKNGPGKIFYRDIKRDRFEGHFRKGKKHGIGRLYYKNGKILEFLYEDGKILKKNQFFEEKTGQKKKEDLDVEWARGDRMDYDSIVCGDQIGKGGFGSVYAGVWNGRGGGIEIAIKLIQYKDPAEYSTSYPDHLLEMKSMMKCKHPLVLSVFGYAVCPKKLQLKLVMEKMHMDLRNYVKKYNITFSHKIDLMKKMTQCLNYLHSVGIIHRDVKGANFLVSKDGKTLKIADFGLAREKKNSVDTFIQSRLRGTPHWMAPETLCKNPKFSRYSDIYSLAVTFLEILNEDDPFRYELARRKISKQVLGNMFSFSQYVGRDGRRPMLKSCVPVIFKNLLNKCWVGGGGNPEDSFRSRISTEEIIKWIDKNKSKIVSQGN